MDVKKITEGEQITDNSKIIMEALYNLLRNFKVPEKAFSIITDKPTWAEIESLTKKNNYIKLKVFSTHK